MRTIRQLLAGEDEIQLAIRLALLALLIYWSFVVIRPFVPILAWSVVLAVALYPVFSWLSGLLGNRPKLAAAVLTVINLAIIIGGCQFAAVARNRHGDSVWLPFQFLKRRCVCAECIARTMTTCHQGSIVGPAYSPREVIRRR